MGLKNLQRLWQPMAHGKIPGVTFTPEEIGDKTERAAREALVRQALHPFDADEIRAHVKAGEDIKDLSSEQVKFGNLVTEVFTFDADAARERLRAKAQQSPKPDIGT
jgi:hypothetical protein